jgi:hypothetical protein
VDQEQNDKTRWEELELETKTHIVQCEERWKTNFNRLDDIDESLRKIEARTMAVGGGLILFLAGLIVTLVVK